MDKSERDKLKKKINIHKKLGAEKFKKAVFELEKLKYKFIKTVCPNIAIYYDKFCDFKKKRAINKATSEEEIEEIQRNTKFAKMAFRKELNQEKNRNYHMDKKRPTEIYKYLEWNKRVHKNGFIKNAILIPALAGAAIAVTPAVIPLLVAELVSAGINFECINIQDYNMCRFKLMEEKLKKQEAKRNEQMIEEYGDASKLIYDNIEQKEQIPTLKEIISSVKTKEEAEQLRKLIIKELQDRSKEKPMVKELGGNI